MNSLSRSILLPIALISLSGVAASQSFALDFENGTGSWQTVLDGVMGGRSSGRVQQLEPGMLTFTGELSLENNGGFSQIRTAVAEGALAGAKEIVLECRGDGRTYKFDIRLSNVRMMAGAYQQDFETKAGEWIEVRLPLDEFRLYSFGRRVRTAPELAADKIESIGVTLADKKAGDFRLDIRSITAGGREAQPRDANGGQDLASVAKAAGLTTLLDLVGAAGLELPEGKVTIFAPTNDAFAAIPKQTLETLLEPASRETLRQILTYHITPGARSSADVLNVRSLPSLAEQPLKVDGQIAGANIVAVDVPFDGGVVHVIDKVMMPELRSISQIAAATPELSTLMAAVDSANLARQLERQNGPWTIFAPVDSAFAKLPNGTVASLLEPENRRALTQILGLHVVPGRIAARELLAKKRLTSLMGQPVATSLRDGSLTIGDGARIVQADIQAANGVIHLIDSVLLPKQEAPVAETVKTIENERVHASAAGRDLREAYIAVYEVAVERGVPLFNDGNPEACAAIYEVAVEALIQLGGTDLGEEALTRLSNARAEAETQATARERAWTLRRAMDAGYRLLENGGPQRATLPARGSLGAR